MREEKRKMRGENPTLFFWAKKIKLETPQYLLRSVEICGLGNQFQLLILRKNCHVFLSNILTSPSNSIFPFRKEKVKIRFFRLKLKLWKNKVEIETIFRFFPVEDWLKDGNLLLDLQQFWSSRAFFHREKGRWIVCKKN